MSFDRYYLVHYHYHYHFTNIYKVPMRIIDQFAQSTSQGFHVSRLEKIILKIDLKSIEFVPLFMVCKQYCLHYALCYISIFGLDEWLLPFEEMYPFLFDNLLSEKEKIVLGIFFFFSFHFIFIPLIVCRIYDCL